jgi:hypothetical protein
MIWNVGGKRLRPFSRSSRGYEVEMDVSAGERLRFFLLGSVVGAAFGSLVVSLLTQYVEHGDVLYPARVRLSRRGRHVNFELLLQ